MFHPFDFAQDRLCRKKRGKDGAPSARLLRENSLRHYCQSKIESRSFDWSAIRKRMAFGAQDDRVKEQDDKVEGAG